MTDIQPATTSLILGNHPGLKNTLGMEWSQRPAVAPTTTRVPSENSGAYDQVPSQSKQKLAAETGGKTPVKTLSNPTHHVSAGDRVPLGLRDPNYVECNKMQRCRRVEISTIHY